MRLICSTLLLFVATFLSANTSQAQSASGCKEGEFAATSGFDANAKSHATAVSSISRTLRKTGIATCRNSDENRVIASVLKSKFSISPPTPGTTSNSFILVGEATFCCKNRRSNPTSDTN